MKKKTARLFSHFVKPIVILPVLMAGIVFGWQHYLSASRSLDIPKNNLLINGSFEELNEAGLPADWQVAVEGGTTQATASIKKGYTGKRDIRVDIANYDKGTVNIVSPKVAVEPGVRYFFKAYYITDADFDLVVRYHYKDGTQERELIRHYLDYDYPWSTMSGGVTIGEGIEAITFAAQLSSKGYIEMDGAYVIKTDTEPSVDACPADGNVVPNPQLSTIVGGAPQGWEPFQYGNNKATNQIVASGNDFYARSEISAYTNGEAKWVYTPVATAPHSRYCASFEYRSDVRTDIMAEYTLTNGTIKYNYLGTLLPAGNWTRVTVFAETPAEAKAIMVSVELISKGYVETDNYQLVRLPGDGTTFKRPLVSVTFDDGWATSYTNGASLLDAYGMKGTFYINPGYVGDEDIVTFDQLLDLKRRGHHLGSHGNLHIDLTAFSAEKVKSDLSASQDYAVKRLGISQVDFASPYGKHDARADTIIQSLYASHRGTELGINTKQNFSKYDLKALFVRKDTTLEEVREFLEDAKANNGWLILVYHQIEDSSDPFIVSKKTLEAHLKAAKQSGITVKPVRGALTELQSQL
ncbi:MAG TPA: polysaccharide deacetylase family protein [Candidatus Saccharimonadales bacterium]|nr:polysaccharide deacetylase family protein [Candidatus Saccharimonadales bacterium]